MKMNKYILTLFTLCNLSTLAASELIRDPAVVDALLKKNTFTDSIGNGWKVSAPATVFNNAGELLGYYPKELYSIVTLHGEPKNGIRQTNQTRAIFTAIISSKNSQYSNLELRIEAECFPKLAIVVPQPAIELRDFYPQGLTGDQLAVLANKHQGKITDTLGINWFRRDVRFKRPGLNAPYDPYRGDIKNFEPESALDSVDEYDTRCCIIIANAVDLSGKPVKARFTIVSDSQYRFKPYQRIQLKK